MDGMGYDSKRVHHKTKTEASCQNAKKKKKKRNVVLVIFFGAVAEQVETKKSLRNRVFI